MTRRSLGTLEGAIHVDSRNYEYFFLCPELRKKRMIPLVARVRARTLEEFGELVRHSGEEFFYGGIPGAGGRGAESPAKVRGFGHVKHPAFSGSQRSAGMASKRRRLSLDSRRRYISARAFSH
jgi:hypothetical protein